MKKPMIVVILLILLILLCFAMVDYIRVSTFRKPIFCIRTLMMKDGGSGKYVGLGYSFYIKGNFLPEETPRGITEYEYSTLGIKIKSVIRN